MSLQHWETFWSAAIVLIFAIIGQSASGLSEPFLVFTHANGLEALNLTSLTSQKLYSNGQNVLGVDGIWNDGNPQVFWGNNMDGKIFKGSWLNGSFDDIELLVLGGESSVEGIAVDWISRNLFWVESQFGWIEMVSLDNPSLRSVVITGIHNPRAIAVDSRDGLLFWTDWCDSPKIERSSLSGGDRVSIVDIARGGFPNGLTLDYGNRRVFWVDAKTDSIHSSDYHGQSRLEHTTEPSVMQNPFGLSIYEDNLIWADASLNSVQKIGISNKNSSKILYETYRSVYGVTLLHPHRHPSDFVNPCASGQHNCSHLCVVGADSGAVCGCPTLMVLGSDNLTCEGVKDLLILSELHKEGSDGYNVVFGLTTNSIPFHPVTSPIITPVHSNAFGLEADSSSRFLYWADRHSNVIARASINDGNVENLFDLGIGTVTGFASDFPSGRLFYAMSGFHWGIYSCSLTNYVCEKIVNTSDATLLTVQKEQNRLIWVERNGKVFKGADFDGTHIKELCKANNMPEFSDFAVASEDSSALYLISGSAITKLGVGSGKSAPFATLPGDAVGRSIFVKDDRILVGDQLGRLHVWNLSSASYLGVAYNSTSAVTALTSILFNSEAGGSDCKGHRCDDTPAKVMEPNDSPVQSTSSTPSPTTETVAEDHVAKLPPPKNNHHVLSSIYMGPRKTNPSSTCDPPCLHGGSCETDMMGQWSCRCPLEFHGTACQLASRNLSSICHGFCQHGGLCFEERRTGRPLCQCQPGFYGLRCQGSLCADFCRFGRCELVNGRPQCVCESGWSGSMCSRREMEMVAVNAIQLCDVYCLHGGTCVPSASSSQLPECRCTSTYRGLQCEISTEEPFSRMVVFVSVCILTILGLAVVIRIAYQKYKYNVGILKTTEGYRGFPFSGQSIFFTPTRSSRSKDVSDVTRIHYTANLDDDNKLLIQVEDFGSTSSMTDIKSERVKS